MIVTCESCGARYKLADSKLSGRGAKITCPKCAHVFVVLVPRDDGAADAPAAVGGTPRGQVGATSSAPSGRGQVSGGAGGRGAHAAVATLATAEQPEGEPSVPPAGSAPTAPPSPPQERSHGQGRGLPVESDVNAVDFRKVGIDSWKVKKASIGLVYDYHDYRALHRSLRENRINGGDQLSHDGSSWVGIGDIEDLALHMLGIYNRLAAGAGDGEQDAARRGGDHHTDAAGMPVVPPGAAADGQDLKAVMEAISSGDPNAAKRRFDDPFKDLRARQRGRAAAAEDVSAAVSTPARKEPNKAVRVTVVLVCFLGVFGVAAWYLHAQTRQSITTVDGAETVSRQAPEWGKRKAEQLRKSINEDLRDMEQAADDPDDLLGQDENQLIPVVPREFRGGAQLPGTGLTQGTASVTSGAATARDHYEVGRDAQGRGDWTAASQAFGQAARMEPGDAAYQEAYGVALYNLAQLDPASRALAAASSVGSRTAEKWLGHIARDQGDVSGAVGHYRNYLKTNPADASAIQQEVDQLTR